MDTRTDASKTHIRFLRQQDAPIDTVERCRVAQIGCTAYRVSLFVLRVRTPRRQEQAKQSGYAHELAAEHRRLLVGTAPLR